MGSPAHPAQDAEADAHPRAYPGWLTGLSRLRAALLTLAAYNVATFVSILIGDDGLNISTIWLASGVGLVAVLVWGYWLLPVILVSDCLADVVLGNFSLLPALGISAVTTAEIAAMAWILRRGRQGGALAFDVSGTARFAVACLLLPIGGAFCAATWLWMVGHLPGEAVLSLARDWWLSVMLGIMCVVPLINHCLVHGLPRFHGQHREAVTVLFALALLSAMILTYQVVQQQPVEAVFYASLPLMLWASVFLREAGAALALTLTTTLAIVVNHLAPAQAVPLWSIGAHVVAFGLMSLMIANAQSNLARMMFEHSHQAQLAQLAYHDSLTGLANRAMFQEKLVEALEASRTEAHRVAVLFIDLDGFKWINDTLGHAAGDELIRAVALRFQRLVPSTDLVARLGGDEFAVLLNDVPDTRTAREVAHRLIQRCNSQAIAIGRNRVHVEASVGVALYPDHAADPQELLRLADLSMYEAKRLTGPSVVMFTPAFERDARTRHELQQDLRQASEENQFRLAYQPVIDLNTREVACVETLLRWEHPTRGMIQPDTFIPLLEQSGLIAPVGRWVLHQACAQLAQWRKTNPELRVSVNVSVSQFQTDDLLRTVTRALTEAELPPDALVIEVTESVFAGHGSRADQHLRALADHGVGIAMDDFGTGYSALASLHQLPLDIVKIDRSFIADIRTDPTNHALVTAILELARTLSLEPIAEGVETDAQADQLRKAGCALAQGFLFARPMPAPQLTQWLADQGRMPPVPSPDLTARCS